MTGDWTRKSNHWTISINTMSLSCHNIMRCPHGGQIYRHLVHKMTSTLRIQTQTHTRWVHNVMYDYDVHNTFCTFRMVILWTNIRRTIDINHQNAIHNHHCIYTLYFILLQQCFSFSLWLHCTQSNKENNIKPVNEEKELHDLSCSLLVQSETIEAHIKYVATRSILVCKDNAVTQQLSAINNAWHDQAYAPASHRDTDPRMCHLYFFF